MKNQTLIIAGVAVISILGIGYVLLSSNPTKTTSTPSNNKVAQVENQPEAMEKQSVGTIVDVASSNKDFSTLVSAVVEAGLVETLSGKGPFTVFAPTNEAFAKIPKATLDSLLKDKAALTKVLTYHVVAGEVPSKEVVTLKSAKTVQGQEVLITVKNGEVFINDSKVITTDIQTSNGIIHVIDTVLLPK